MRHQLEPFEGQLVFFMGYIATRVEQADDLHDMCLQAVSVRKFDPTQPVMASKPVKVDHLWLQSLEGSHLSTKELMRKTSGIARCRYYTRKNGSVDLGLNAVISYCWDDLGNAISQAKSWAEYCNCIETAKEHLDNHRGVIYALHESPPLIEQWFQRCCRQVFSSKDAEITRLITATANGPCKGLNVFPKVKRGRKTVRGFA